MPAKKGCIPWNKGLTKKTDSRVLSPPNKGIRGSTTGKGSTPEKEEERRRKIAEKAKLNNGGYRQGSGRGKKGWYKGFFCDSSWELAFVIYCLENNKSISRNTKKRQYVWEGKIKNYIPDFIVDGEIIEIKGFKTEEWDAKHLANPDIRVLYAKDLQDVFSYVTSKYGKDYVKLYEEGQIDW